MKPHRNPMQLVNVELTAGELRRLQICLYERIEMLQEQLRGQELKPEQRRRMKVDAVHCAADLTILTDKALAV